MLRLAVIQPDSKRTDYRAAAARTNQFHVTHVVGSAMSVPGAKTLHNEAVLLQHKDEFDACVLHAPSLASESLGRLLEAGKQLLLEGPGFHDTMQLTRLRRTADACNGRLFVTQPSRFTAYARCVREALDSGQLGQPGLVRIHRWENHEVNSDAPPDVRLRAFLAQEIDLACWLFGGPPITVLGSTIPSHQSARGWIGHLGFVGGMAIIDCASHQSHPYYTLSLIGSTGASYADDHHNSNLLFGERTEAIRVSGCDDSWRHQLDAFVASVRHGGKNDTGIATAADLQRVLTVCDATIQSAQTACVAKLIGDHYELQH